MATYNRADGTGGLDASIRWEQSRAEASCSALDAVPKY